MKRAQRSGSKERPGSISPCAAMRLSRKLSARTRRDSSFRFQCALRMPCAFPRIRKERRPTKLFWHQRRDIAPACGEKNYRGCFGKHFVAGGSWRTGVRRPRSNRLVRSAPDADAISLAALSRRIRPGWRWRFRKTPSDPAASCRFGNWLALSASTLICLAAIELVLRSVA